jgi:hypothetical protein
VKNTILVAALLITAYVTLTWAQVPAAATVAAGVVNEDVYPDWCSRSDCLQPLDVSRRADGSVSAAGDVQQSSTLHCLHTWRGWSGGSKRTTGAFSNWPGVLAALAAKGYVVASLDYRLVGDEIAPAAIQDTKAAIRFLRANAAKYNVDKNRGLTWGPSAGGQLAALAATSCGATALSPPPGPAWGAARRGGRAAGGRGATF